MFFELGRSLGCRASVAWMPCLGRSDAVSGRSDAVPWNTGARHPSRTLDAVPRSLGCRGYVRGFWGATTALRDGQQ